MDSVALVNVKESMSDQNLDSTTTSTHTMKEDPLKIEMEDPIKIEKEDLLKIEIETDPPLNEEPDVISELPSTSTLEDNNVNNYTRSPQEELLEFLKYNENNSPKRKRCDEEEPLNVTTGIFLRAMYPLNETMDKTITVGVFKSLNFKPAVLINQCGKSCMLLNVEM